MSLRGVAATCGVLVAAAGAATLVGWAWQIRILTTVAPGLPAMRPITAVAFVCAGVALFLYAVTAGRIWHRIATALSGVVAGTAALSLVDYLLGWTPALDIALLRRFPGLAAQWSPAQMAEAAAVAFLCAGLSLLTHRAQTRRRRSAHEWLVLISGAIGLFGLIGYVYSIRSPYGVASYSGMALHTSAGFVVLSLGLLAETPDGVLPHIVLGTDAGSVAARRLLPFAILLPPLLGWLALATEDLRRIGQDYGTALMIFANVAIFTGIAWWTSQTVSRMDALRAGDLISLQQSEEAFRLMFAANPLPMWVYDLETLHFVEVNDAAIAHYGYSRDEFLMMRITDIRPPEDVPRLLEDLARPRPPGRSVEQRRHRRKDGAIIDVEIASRRFSFNGNDSVLAVSTDVTERRRGEAERLTLLARAQTAREEVERLNAELERRVTDRTAQLEAANKELEAFSYSVAHDLRAPLRAIDGFSRLVVDEYAAALPAEGRRYLERVRTSAQQMGELIDDLLTFSRLARQPLDRRRVDTTRLVEQVIEQLRAERGLRTMPILLDALPASEADPALLRQVFANLLSNALKFSRTRPVPRIEVTSRADAGTPVFIVRDNGVGFDMRYADKLFGVFQRLHRAEEYEGTGVGLAIVQRIVHRHGGTVWAEAEPDRGATFYFTLGGSVDGNGSGGNPAG